MKRITIALLLIVSLFSVFSATIDPFKVQTISGFIDDISYLYVSPFTFDYIGTVGYAGINLDYEDTTASYRNLVKPSSTPLSMLGVQIGSFSVLVTYTQSTTISGAKLTITHEKLIHTTNPSAQLEYELGVLYAISNGTTTGTETSAICLSTEATGNNPKKIEITLSQQSKIAAIQNAYLYFRLANGQKASVTGQYESVVTFTMEAI